MSDDFREPVYTVREPAPADTDVAFYQDQLDRLAGFVGPLRRLRLTWAPDCMVTVDGEARAQYVYPVHVTTQCKMVTETLESGDRIHHLLPFDEDKWEPELERLKGLPFAIRNYYVERAVCAWIIQALIPARVYNKGRNDDELDVSNGAYELAHWCTSDGTEFGQNRPVVQNDIDAVKALWRERETYMRHRHEDEAAPEFWRLQSKRRFQRMKARRDAQIAAQREELNDRAKFFVKQLAGSVDVIERDGVPFRVRGRGENKLISLPKVLLPKERMI